MTAQGGQQGAATGQNGQGAAGQRGQQPPAQGRGRGGGPITIRAAHVLDGKGGELDNAVIEIQGSKITKVDHREGPVTYDLGTATVLPGMIDVHVHLNWTFGSDGRYGTRGDTAGYAIDAELDNARATLLAGFTTVQSLGAASDKPLREAIAAGVVVGPRLLTSISQLQPRQATPASADGSRPGRPADSPEDLRRMVRDAKAAGADVIKIFASGSIRDGGKMNVTQEQLDAACGEAKALGLRSLVHAHDPQSIIASVKAGCTQIEHGLFADDAAIKAMKDANVYFDPNIGLVLQNYLEHKDQYMGSGNFNAEGFASMQNALPLLGAMFKKALAAGLKMPMGTDAVAGAHGQNAREIIARVQVGGQTPMDALVGATSLSAESLGLGTQIGTIAAGYEADLVAVPADPSKDITALRNVKFVMKGGRVFKK